MFSVQGLFKASKALMSTIAKPTSAVKTASVKPKPKPKPRSKPSPETPKTVRPTGISKVLPVSPPLQGFLGVTASSRTDAVKKVWEYIKLHNLQTPEDKKVILCDDKLKMIFEGKDKVGFLEIGKLLSRHFIKTEV